MRRCFQSFFEDDDFLLGAGASSLAAQSAVDVETSNQDNAHEADMSPASR